MTNQMLPRGTVEILSALEGSSKRFSELARIKVASRPINRRTLVLRLKMLEKEKLIKREIQATWPPTPKYTLTEHGQRFLDTLRE